MTLKQGMTIKTSKQVTFEVEEINVEATRDEAGKWTVCHDFGAFEMFGTERQMRAAAAEAVLANT